MNEILRKEIWRKLEGLPDEKAYQVLDYVNFLRSRYSEGDGRATSFQRIGEAVQETMRKGKVPARALKETMKVMSTADRMLDSVREAGREFLVELEGNRPEPAPPETPQEPPRTREIVVE